jgi:Asp-tRNA(Asn)/Glu-tRNA(Gln) amidotransferase A subunit family amidase
MSSATSARVCATAEPGMVHPSVREAIVRSAVAEPALQAWAHLARADTLDAPHAGPLYGWPLGVKDVLDVAGMPTRCGSPVSSAHDRRFDAACVAQLRAAGAVPIGKTVTTEYAHVTPGPTRNPVNLLHTPGGSSSGSAAAVAAGLVPIALGTQTGGSMIRPAAFCGVVGFKPTIDMVSRQGMRVMCESLDTIGWYGESIHHVQAVGSILLPRVESTDRPLSELKIAFLDGNPGHVPDAAAADALARACRHMKAQGVDIVSAGPFAPATELLAAYDSLMHFEFARSLQPVVDASGGRLSDRLMAAVARGRQIEGSAYLQARAIQAHQRLCWDQSFGSADLVLTSSALGSAPEGLGHTGDSAFNKGWSVLGWPCIHLPTTHAPNGLPLGVLLVARPFADAELLRWAGSIHPVIDERLHKGPSSLSPLSGNSRP